MQLARKALSEGRGLVIVANKSDLLTGGVTVNSYETGVKEHSGEYLREFGDIPVVATCAISGKGVHRVCLRLMYKGLLCDTGGVLFHVEWCIRKPWCSSNIL